MSRNDKESQLCVAGQNTIFLSKIMNSKLMRLEQLYKKSRRQNIHKFRRIYRAWRAIVAQKKRSVIRIQSIARGYLMRSRNNNTRNSIPPLTFTNEKSVSMGQMSRSLCSVIQIQSYYRGRMVRKLQMTCASLMGSFRHL